MKFKILVFFVFLANNSFSAIKYACNRGTYMYPNSMGATNNWNPPVMKYYNTEPIYLRNWSGDKSSCGVLRDNITKVLPETGCEVIGSGGGGGVMYSYESSLNNCPLDDYTPLLILVFGIFGFYYIWSKKHIILNKP